MMQAVAFQEYGPVDVLKLIDLPRPEAGTDEVVIRVHAAAVNPADPKWRQGMFQSFAPVSFPHVLGYDVAGVIDTIGTGVAGFSVGDPVFAMLNSATKGGYAEFAAVREDSVVRMPVGLDFATAAALPTAGLTGVQMVEDYANVQAGHRVLITGTAGSVGRFALHAAQERGAHVVAAVRASHCDEINQLGVENVLVLGSDDWSGKPFDHVIDTVGGAAVATLCRHLKTGGGIFTAATTPIPAEGLVIAPVFVVVRQDPTRLARLANSVAAGDIAITIAQKLPLGDFKRAQILVEQGGNSGKIILEPI